MTLHLVYNAELSQGHLEPGQVTNRCTTESNVSPLSLSVTNSSAFMGKAFCGPPPSLPDC